MAWCLSNAEIERIERLHNLGYTPTEISERVGRCLDTIWRLRREGFPRKPAGRRARPADFETVAAELSVLQLKDHYHASYNCVRRWLDECKIDRTTVKNRSRGVPKVRPCPDNFAEVLAEHGWRGVKRIFKVGCSKTLKRWKAESDAALRPRSPAFRPIERPAAYDQIKHKLGAPRDMFGIAA